VSTTPDSQDGRNGHRGRLLWVTLTTAVLITAAAVIWTPAAVAHLAVITDQPSVSAAPTPTPLPTLRPAPDAGSALQGAVTGIPDYGLIAKAQKEAAAASDPQYADCAAVKAAGKAPIAIGSPGFQPRFDPDGNGIGCE
jgi:hypothetical protein